MDSCDKILLVCGLATLKKSLCVRGWGYMGFFNINEQIYMFKTFKDHSPVKIVDYPWN